jgi:hypothetical protein
VQIFGARLQLAFLPDPGEIIRDKQMSQKGCGQPPAKRHSSSKAAADPSRKGAQDFG